MIRSRGPVSGSGAIYYVNTATVERVYITFLALENGDRSDRTFRMSQGGPGPEPAAFFKVVSMQELNCLRGLDRSDIFLEKKFARKSKNKHDVRKALLFLFPTMKYCVFYKKV